MATRLRSTLIVLVILAAAPVLLAGYGSGNPRLEGLYSTFLSPCCWRENLSVHDSQVAQELRDQIAAMVQAGESDDEIKARLVRAYGKRILTLPEGEERMWLFLTPLVAAVLGLGLVGLALKRLRTPAAPET